MAFLLDLFEKAPGIEFTFTQIASPLGFRWIGSRDPRKFRRFGEFFANIRVCEQRSREHFAIKLGTSTDFIREVENGLLPDRSFVAKLVKTFLPTSTADEIEGAFPALRPSDDELALRARIMRIRSLGPDDRKKSLLENELAKDLLPTAVGMARKAGLVYGRPRDAEEVAGEAVTLAMRRHDPRRGLFFPYLKIVVRSLVRELNRMDMQSGVAAALRDHGFSYKEARNSLTHELHREPMTCELAEYLGLTENAIIEIARAIDASYCSFPEDLEYLLIKNSALHIDNQVDFATNDCRVPRLRNLPETQREILYLRFDDGLSTFEIAEKLDMAEQDVTLKLQWAIAQVGA